MTASEAALANGKEKADPRDRQIAALTKQLSECDKVIGELTIANRLLKTGGQIVLTEQFREELKQMIAPNSMVRITHVLDALGLPCSSWYRPLVPASERKRPSPAAWPNTSPSTDVSKLVLTLNFVHP